MATSNITNKAKIHYIDVDLSGTAVTSADAGWYFAQIPLNLPSGAVPFSVQPLGGWEASVQYALNLTGTDRGIIIKSPTALTLGANRRALVFYYFE